MNLLLHERSKKAIDDFLLSPSHALLILGDKGSGKGTVASEIASNVLKLPIEKLQDYPYLLWLKDKEKGILIEDIRGCTKFVQLKTPGEKGIRRVIIIEQAETMGGEAQNALLKLLEEPPTDTLIILTSSSKEKILPTILSRTQQIKILSPSLENTVDFFKPNYAVPDITKNYYISDGKVGLLLALLDNNDNHPLVEQINQAKTLLSSTSFERLAKVDQITKTKDVGTLLIALERVCHAALISAIKSANPASKNWTKKLEAVISARKALDKKAQPKLLLTKLMLEL